MEKSYETPELMELGAAESLTLGGRGCADDGCDCCMAAQVPDASY